MVKQYKTIDSFFKRQCLSGGDKPLESSVDELRPYKITRVELKEVDNNETDMPLVSLVDDQCPSETPGVNQKNLATYNDDVAKVVLENASKNAKYTSPKIQKELLQILSNKVRMHIREEIGDAKFCILVNEARDVAKKEQMALVLKFVDKEDFIRERFLDIVYSAAKLAKSVRKPTRSERRAAEPHKKNHSQSDDHEDQTNEKLSLVLRRFDLRHALKKELSLVLSRHALNIQNIRGQGYNRASNMRVEVVISFCARYEINVPDMSARYLMGRSRSCQQRDHITIEHHYRVEVFTVAIDSQLQELNIRLIRLVSTLPVSTTTTERAFSGMKLVKTSLRNKMNDKFLADYLTVYIEMEIAEKFNSDR
ncbi:hypothetical protein Ddye_028441 [Dipteronia dyeriana]|uniref:DUF4371 domain-containing protein n=1 Tax=Dipteronia dyeriana TaxID=168575 RepID=A0AAD9TR68_9ROSI|nr:hypothetical protein Ddye_028441 [Dipteronia dyeriana]